MKARFKKKKVTPLAEVSNPAGRLDVAAYRAFERLLERWEGEGGLVGLRDNLLPIIEHAIVSFDLPRCDIPPELKAIVKVLEENRRRP